MRRKEKLIDHGLIKLFLFALVMLTPISAWAEDYPITVAGVQVTSDNATEITGTNITGTVTYDAGNYKLKLNNVNITGFICSSLEELTIELTGTNTIFGGIQFRGTNDVSEGNLIVTGTGSLEMTGQDGDSPVIYFTNVTIGSGLYLQTNEPGAHWDSSSQRFKASGNNLSALTITSDVYYPIWVISDGVYYIQVSGENKGHVLGDNNTTVTYDSDNDKLILNNFVCSTTDGEYAICLGDQEEFKIHLLGQNTISGSGVSFVKEVASLVFSTDAQSPGSLTIVQPEQGSYPLTSIGDGAVSYENGLGYTDHVVSTGWTRLIIGETEITETTQTVVGYDGVSFNAESNTLALSGATIPAEVEEIIVYADNLIVEISDDNTINGTISYYGQNFDTSSIQIKKASGAESASLKVTNVEGFTSCTWGDGLYLSAQDVNGAVIDVHYEHFEGEGGRMQSYYGGEPAEVIFSTTQPSNTIWVNGISPNADGNFIDPTTNQPIEGLSFKASTSTLTLTNASISTNDDNPSPLIICNGDLTVNLVGEDNGVYFNGDYATYIFKNNGATGSLTFTGESSLHINSDYDEGTYFGLCDGFSTVDFGDLAYTINGDSKKISPLNISTPMMNVYEGKIDFTTEGYLFGSTTYYKIVYADGSGNEEEVPLTNVVSNQTFDFNNYNEKITISELTGPCTVYAYTKYKTETGNSAKAKLFVFNDKKIALNSNTELTADMLDIQPAIEENDGVNLTIVNSYNLDAIEYSEGTGKATIVGIGSCNLDVKMTLSDTPQVTVLNMNGEVAMFSTEVTVVPAAPTIVKDPEKTYLDTDKITINLPEGEIYENCNIFYTWDEEVEVEAYALFNESETVIKKYTSPIPALTGTLRAWVGYPYGDDYYYYGIEATPQDFEVIPSIANAVVVGLENKTYTGAAITPSFAVKASAEAEDNLTEGTDYEVSYEVAPVVQPQGAPSRRAPESVEIKNAGLYNIVITGKGAYGGTKTVPFTVNKADLADVTIEAIADQIYTGEDLTPTLTITFNENAVAATEYSVSYTKEGTATQSIVNPGQYTITLTSTNKNFTENSTKSATFNILRDLGITFEGTNLWASYYATENLAVPEGLTAYVVSDVNEMSGEVTVARVDYLPKDNAVLLERASDAPASGYVAAQYTGTTSSVTNKLLGRAVPVPVSEIEGTVYVLYNNVFKRTTSGTIPARRAYLVPGAAVAPAGAPQYLTISINDGNTTAIDTLTVDDNSNDSWYTIDGLKLNGKPQREGLYINNGKKVFIKK